METDSSEIVEKVLKYKNYFGKEGGVTLSGGEPLMQAGFACEILKKCMENNINTAIDTAGYELTDNVKKCLKYTGLALIDLKHSNPDKHSELTGHELSRTLKFIEYVSSHKIRYWIRQVIVPGLTDSEEQVIRLLELLKTYNPPEKVELLSYHRMAIEKWKEIHKEYKYKNIPEPDEQVMKRLQKLVNSKLL